MRQLTFVLLLASCGFAGEADFRGARLGQGGAPWTDLGVATICLTPTLLGPPDSDPVGLCIPQAQGPGGGCRSDLDCRSRERCICGSCSVQFCDGPGQCGPDKDCNFRTNACGVPCSNAKPCPGDNDICLRGFCTIRCNSDDECQTGESCDVTARQPSCTTAMCKSNVDCVSGVQSCNIQRNPADLREPALVDAPLAMFVELRPSDSTGVIYRATTTDNGQTWHMDPATPVLEPDPAERRIGAPSVIARGGQLVMFFEAPDGIERATSSDGGHSWTRDHVKVADGTSPGAVVLPTGAVLLFHEAAGGSLAMARASDGVSFQEMGTVVTPQDMIDPLLWRQIDRLGQPFARASDGRVQLWFTGHGVETSSAIQSGMPLPPTLNDSIGYAVSEDGGMTFTPFPFNPVFDRTTAFVQHEQERTPTIAAMGDGYLMLYGAADDKGIVQGLGVAHNP